MKYLFVLVSVLAAFGAGCVRTTKSMDSTPSVPPISAVVVPGGWEVYSNTSPNFSFAYPKDALAAKSDSFPDDLILVDFGLSVTNTRAISVPDRQLHVRVVAASSPNVKDCFYSESGWPSGYASMRQEKVTFNGAAFCLSVERDAGAGNYYDTYNYLTKTGDQYVLMNFVVHSVNCLNYDNPAEKCVDFDESRDTAIFADVMNTFSLAR